MLHMNIATTKARCRAGKYSPKVFSSNGISLPADLLLLDLAQRIL